MAVNAPMQGTQSDIIKLAMVRADALIEKNGLRPSAGSGQAKARLILQIHDELVYEIAERDAEKIARDIKTVMESIVPKGELHDVPLTVEISIGKNWGEMRKLGNSSEV